jgi:hypothetical protein
MPVRTHLAEGEIAYHGPELSSHFAYKRFDVLGDSCVAFIGPCDVPTENLADLADRKQGERIYSRRMLHFLIEHFDERDLEKGVLRQRLFTAIVQQALVARGAAGVTRSGDDLYVGDAKLSVSIAALSGVSSVIHFGINVESAGTPVKTLGLADLAIEERAFARAVLDAYAAEQASIDEARCKTRAVP